MIYEFKPTLGALWEKNEQKNGDSDVVSGMAMNLPLPEGNKKGDCWACAELEVPVGLCKNEKQRCAH